MCYADNNALTTGTTEDMNHNLRIVNDFCEATGMRLNIKKSAAFSITPSGSRSYSINNHKTPLTINGEAVPLLIPEDCLKYLGSKMNPLLTKVCKNLVVELKSMLQKVDKASLKPRQKLVMTNQFVLARLNYSLTQDAYPTGVLKDLNKVLRSYVWKWLKLPESSPNAFFYEIRGKGDLGLPLFELSVPAARINMLRLISRSNDPKIRNMSVRFGMPRIIDAIVTKCCYVI